MLILKKTPKVRPVPLGGDAVAMVRPASVFDYELASSKAATLLAGLVTDPHPIERAVDIFGPEFFGADPSSPEWVQRATGCAVLIELATRCITSWTGIGDEHGNPIEKPSRATVALLLRSAEIALRIRAAVESSLYETRQEDRPHV